MYHIKSDKRSQKTAQKLGTSMLQLLQVVPINEVTVFDLYRQTGISRSTFYRLFDTPEDILHYLCAQYVEEMTNYFENHVFSDIKELCIASINFSIQKHELLDVLVKNHRIELLTEMYAANFQNIIDRVPMLVGLSETSSEYIRSFLYMTMSAVQTTWVKRGRIETPEQIFEILKEYSAVWKLLLDHFY